MSKTRKRRQRRLKNTVLILSAVGSACGAGQLTSSAKSADSCAVNIVSWRDRADAVGTLVFNRDGSRLLVAGRWSFDPETARFRPLLRCQGRHSETIHGDVVLAPAGTGLVVVAKDRYALGTLEGALDIWHPIPRWLPPTSATNEVSNVAAFLSSKTLLIHQSYVGGDGAPSCRTLDLSTHALGEQSIGCPPSGFTQVAALSFGPGNIVQTLSAAEGAIDLTVVRHGNNSNADKTVTSITLQGLGSVDSWVSADGARVQLLSPCELRGNPPPACESDEGAVRLYEVSSEKSLHLVRTDLPPGAVKNPVNEQFAWVEAAQLCVGNPAGDKRCTSLPQTVVRTSKRAGSDAQ